MGLCLGAAWLMGCAALAGPESGWTWRNPLPTANNLSSVAFGKGVFVAVGGWGTIVTSVDGKSWQEQGSGTLAGLRGVAFGKGVFVTVGEAGTILTSDDGRRWVKRALASGEGLGGVSFGEGVFAALGGAGSVLFSTDGKNWTVTPGVTTRASGIAAGNGRFVVLERTAGVRYSLDGINWRTASLPVVGLPDMHMYGLCFGQGQFVAVGEVSGDSLVYTSPDGVLWTERKTGVPTPLFSIAYAGRTFVAVGHDYATIHTPIVTSTDLVKWNSQEPRLRRPLNATAYGNGVFVTVGSRGTVLTADDRLDFHRTSSAWLGSLRGVAYGNGSFLAVGDGLMRSADGVNWDSLDSRMEHGLVGVTWGSNEFVAVGSGVIERVSPAEGWTVRTSAAPAYLTRVLYTGKTYLALSDSGGILNFDSGLAEAGSPDRMYGAARSGDRCVAVGYNGVIKTSVDGVDWARATVDAKSLNGVAWGNGVFVAVGDLGKVFISPDGLAWRGYESGTSRNLRAVTFADGVFVAAGAYGAMAASTDGTHWMWMDSRTSFNLQDVAFGGGRFMAVAASGIILESRFGPSDLLRARIADPARLSGGQVEMTLWGLAPELEVQASADLLEWRSLARLFRTNFSGAYLDGEASGVPGRFYRLSVP
jgi:hypothetical protein